MRCTAKPALYDPHFEHDACGIGFVATISGHPSHEILQTALDAVMCMAHRGAVDADARTGDGAGILTQIPYALFARELTAMGKPVPPEGALGVGMCFLPRKNREARDRCRAIIQTTLEQHGCQVLGWRPVPVDPLALGQRAADTQPDIQQVFFSRPAQVDSIERFESLLYLVRRQIEGRVRREGIQGCYIPSLSARTIVYKGLFVSPQLPRFYADLRDPEYETALAVFHQRYSTNTFPTWERAQPFRLMCHNGEINTLQGNINWMRARERDLASPVWGTDIDDLRPIIDLEGSDSAMLDNVLELLVRAGRDIRHALMMLIPEAWERIPDMDPAWRAFYQYHACLMEPWDGPAGITFTDGRIVGAVLDRNGLRPLRYLVTDDDLVIVASESGAIEVDHERIVRKGKLGPGQMIAVDTRERVFWDNQRIKTYFAHRRPYAVWVDRHLREFQQTLSYAGFLNLPSHQPPEIRGDTLLQLQAAFGYTAEELTVVIRPMVESSKEPIGSMGDDTPYAVLSKLPRPLFHYFKQRFAEVTNPPIDPLREELVMSTRMLLGARGNLLEESEEHARLLALDGPILQDHELDILKNLDDEAFRAVTWSATFDVRDGPAGLERAIAELCYEASRAVDLGARILILSDRGVGPDRAPIPSLLAVGAVHHHLIREGKRMRVSLIAETGEAREVHHFACLIGYGASAINPYLALATVRDMVESGQLRNKELTPDEAVANYIHAINKGLLKIMSKMGISTLDSYCGAQIFEAIGLDQELVERCFTGTPSRIGGVSFKEIATDVLRWHARAFPRDAEASEKDNGKVKIKLDSPGFYKYKRDGEYHAFSPPVIKQLHKAIRTPDALGENFEQAYQAYRVYADMVNHPERPTELRYMLRFRPQAQVPLEEVEPREAIIARFSTAAMSHGALSAEAHETLAMAMNRLGAASNAGEGGEHEARYFTERNSRAKQVASGRFGVTPAYLISADELQIKMAQGSKPGEGGQLPGHKVTAEIAFIRHTTPGVALISPPPHHDIYSIEDLAQLIYDLKQINPRAKVSVKLVAQAGVGTIAAGVAKGGADVILISGHSGGTGASPLSSIKNAGIPWELGLAETQQTLVLNNLRGRIRLRTDGGLRTGRDVVIAAMLGADEFSFGTAALIAEGCLMARQCHNNTCPVGIASQKPELRSRFPGRPEHVMAYMHFVAEEVREILASLGFRRLDQVIGRVDLLEQVVTGDPVIDRLRLDVLLDEPETWGPRRNIRDRNGLGFESPLNDVLVRDAIPALVGRGPVHLVYRIRNTDRTTGARLAGEIARRRGNKGLPAGSIEVVFHGTAGQSFGAFCINGMRLVLIGEANDYVGKGMSGGEIIIRPPDRTGYAWHESTILGNTALYGATGGQLYAAGRAGERFAVRNSGCLAVVEGVGDHGCEYMTGGAVVVLGETGYNFGAGMTGGWAYVLDEIGHFPDRFNPQLVDIERLSDVRDIELVQWLIRRHAELTGSPRAATILAHWDEYQPLFWRVVPRDSVASIEALLEGSMERQSD